LALSIYDIGFIPAFQKGEAKAYEVIYHQFIDPIRDFVQEMVNDHQAAEDIAVETFTRTFRKNADFVSIEKLRAFLYITASNAAVDFLRRQKRQKEAYKEISYLAATELENIELAYIRVEAARGIREAIAAVPGRAGEVVRMSFLEGKTHGEIATELNITYNTVQNHRARGLQLIRIHLAKNSLLSSTALFVALSMLDVQ
jgi:RNA polymerase sigma factor (sigma-70 family)